MIARERLSLHADRPESLFQVVHGHSPRKRGAPSLGSHTLDSRRRRRKIRYALAAFGLAVCLLLLLINAESVRKLALDGLTALRYRAHSTLREGRMDVGPTCAPESSRESSKGGKSKRRRAIVTLMRTEKYLPLLDHLACSVAKSNPDVEFAVMATRSMSPITARKLEERGLKLIYVEELEYPNVYEQRFRHNWLKVQAWDLPYDEILLVDSDTVILEDVSSLFDLPARFAAVGDQLNRLQEFKFPRSTRMLQGGVLFLRPCPAVASHMRTLLDANPVLRFSTSNAEQEFFSWYFRHEAIILPDRYNTLPSRLDVHNGEPPAIVHFTSNKPFASYQTADGPYRFLCTKHEIELMNKQRYQERHGKGRKGHGQEQEQSDPS